MRAFFPVLAFGLACATSVTAQPMTAATMKTFASSQEVRQLIAKAKADRKGGAPITVEPILSLDSYHANLEYRPIAGPAALHETENELMFVIEGAATITMGGAMVDPKRTNPTNQSAPSIKGGTDTAIAKGDFILVPHGAPHQISAVKGEPLVLMTFHTPQ
ncbi:MAG TPA: hypothetical protein VGM68_13595 [Rhizomicrobium sp.]|jgi:mannose-6-phosphate isomerase-like protein (cupin superfamily)